MKLPFKPGFFLVFLLFLARQVFAYFKLLYYWICRQIPPWKEMKEAFSEKLQTENLCFCLRRKLNETQAAQIRNNAIFKNIHQIIRAYPISKKNLHWSVTLKVLHIGKNLSKVRFRQINVVYSKYIWGAVIVGATPEKFCCLYSLLSLETVFPALWQKKLLYKHEHFLFLKIGN